MSLVAMLLLAWAAAGQRYLVLDSVVDGGNAQVPAEFGDGECAFNVFHPEEASYVPLYADVMLGGGARDITMLVGVYESQSPGKVGTRLAEEAFQVTGTENGAMSRLVFADAEMDIPVMTGNVGVAICNFEHTGMPAPVADLGGTTGTQSKIYADIGTGEQDWYDNADVGISGDWVIRVCIEGEGVTGTPCPEADADADADADTDTDTDTDLDSDAAGLVVLQSITPAGAAFGESVDVVLLGEGFQQGAEAWIGGLRLTGLNYTGDTTLTGRSPSSLPVGVHDVEVVNPDGEGDYLAGAFEVTGEGCSCASSSGSRGLFGVLIAGLVASLRRRRRA